MSLVKTGLTGLARDTSTGALLSTDATAEYSAVLARRAERRAVAALLGRVADLERRVALLEDAARVSDPAPE